MEKLNPNWITEGLIDFEYKKYILLSYLQSTQKSFSEHKLFPFLSELIQHQQNLVAIRDQKQMIENHLPKNISRIDFKNYRLHYEPVDQHEMYLDEILHIVNYAIPKISDQIHLAKHIYDEADQKIDIDSVGIVPVYNDEGYLLFRTDAQNATHVYQYELSIFENNHENYRGLKTTFRETYPRTFYNYDEAIKSDLIRKNKSLPNPATFVLHCRINYPFNETIFPVAKRRFVRFLSRYQA